MSRRDALRLLVAALLALMGWWCATHPLPCHKRVEFKVGGDTLSMEGSYCAEHG